jgi:neurotransmitter:Na+ symporter, NSS family
LPGSRAQWKSKVGFVLAASGSAIGLGNIVFFSANAYTFGAGAFYLPYLLSLFVIGIPLLVAELGLGGLTGQALPQSLGRYGGRWGEFCGWWGLINAAFITMYYVTILAWVCGMLLGAFGPLWQPASPLPSFALDELPNPAGFFFQLLSSWWVLALVAAVWLVNAVILRRGVATIEPAVKVFVPLMWVFMAVLIVRGLTLPHGEEGVFLLFTPDLEIIRDPAVWQGAMSQIFFSLSLGFGIMTAYASYLPKGADHVNNGVVTACMNCAFEFIAGLAVFSLLFTFAIVPRASTLGMMFFVVPEGIAAMPWGVRLYGVLFFLLLLLAGLSSSISLIEGLVSGLIDKFGWSRRRTLAIASGVGVLGSAAFALPLVIDRQLASNGTLGLTLLDLIDHWAFSYGLLVVGLVECLILGWALPVARLREAINRHSRLPLPRAFDWAIKLVIPAAILTVLVGSAWQELRTGLYGSGMTLDWARGLPLAALLFWLGTTVLLALALTGQSRRSMAPILEVEAGRG